MQVRQISATQEALNTGLLQAGNAIEGQVRQIKENLEKISRRQQLLNTSVSHINTSVKDYHGEHTRSKADVAMLTALAHEARDSVRKQQADLVDIKRNVQAIPEIMMINHFEAKETIEVLNSIAGKCLVQDNQLQAVDRTISALDTDQTSLSVTTKALDIPKTSGRQRSKISHLDFRTSITEHIPFTLHLKQDLCDTDCACACHRRNSIRSPNFLNTVLGNLFINYQVCPWSSQVCNKPSCGNKSSRVTYTYAFPRWLMHRILVMNLSFSHRQGPEMNLRIWRVRSLQDNVFHNLRNLRGTEDEIIIYLDKLLDKGLASLLDVSPDGMTCLHVGSLLSSITFIISKS